MLPLRTVSPGRFYRKLFCGGLSLDTTEADLREHFATYGEIEQCTIKMNPVTNKSRCFGFITFATKEALEAAIGVSPHTVKGKQIDPKPAKARPGANKVIIKSRNSSTFYKRYIPSVTSTYLEHRSNTKHRSKQDANQFDRVIKLYFDVDTRQQCIC